MSAVAEPSTTPDASPAARARRLVEAGDRAAASALVADMIAAMTGRVVARVDIGNDEYSLNSVNGRAHFDDGDEVFFKFHVEDGEQDRVGEYYRAKVLFDAGLPVDVPLAISSDPGRQIVLYQVREVPRMSDVCVDLERRDGSEAALPPDLADARRRLDRAVGEVLVRTVGVPTDLGRRPAAVHQLFANRMTDALGNYPGGRLVDWYTSNEKWDALATARWTLNGVTYERTLQELVEGARTLLDPSQFVSAATVVAHGDDHQGNVWVIEATSGPELRMFDPAFAGDDLPALLALVKSTFHNVFAHPLWLYHPHLIANDRVRVEHFRNRVVVDDGGTELSPLRREILDSIVDNSWIPLLRELRDRGLLDPRWPDVVRAGLFACPFLVTNLLGDSRSPAMQLVGLARAVMMGSEPVEGRDDVSEMFARLKAAVEDK